MTIYVCFIEGFTKTNMKKARVINKLTVLLKLNVDNTIFVSLVFAQH